MKKRMLSLLLALCMALTLLPGAALAGELEAEAPAAEDAGGELSGEGSAEMEEPSAGEDPEEPSAGEETAEAEPVEEPQPGEEAQETPAEETESDPALLADTVAYPVDGGNLYFNPFRGRIESSDESITGADIPSSIDGVAVTEIGKMAFHNHKNLVSVTIPNSVTRIGDSSFMSCTNLASVNVPESVASMGVRAFAGCTALEEIKVSGGSRSYQDINGVVYSKDGTVLIVCPAGKQGSFSIPAGVTGIGDNAFYLCKSLTRVSIPRSVTSLGESAFYGCESLTGVMNIPYGLTIIGDGAFMRCTGLSGITIPNSVTRIGHRAFSGCERLSSVTIPGSVASFGGFAFEKCSRLTRAVISDGVPALGVRMFSDCGNLTSVSIPNSVTNIDDLAFCGCKKLDSVTIPESVTRIGENAFTHCERMTGITIPNSVTSIGEYAFSHCTGLTAAAIGNGVTSTGAYIFYNCSALASVILPDSVTSIDYGVFSGCKKLAHIYYGGSEAMWSRIPIDGGNDPLQKAVIHYNSTGADASLSVYSKQPDKFTLTVSENTKGPNSPADRYRLSAGTEISFNDGTSQTGKDGAYLIKSLSSMFSFSAVKKGFAPAERTREQLRANPAVYLEPVLKGYPTVSAVWLDNVDIRHFESAVDLLETDPVTITVDVAWDNAKGEGTVKLVQGAKSVTFSGNSVTTVLKDHFDVRKTIYIWAGYDNEYKTMKPLKLKAASAVPESLNGLAFNLGNGLNFTLPEAFAPLDGMKLGVGLYSKVPVTVTVDNGKFYAAIGLQTDGSYTKLTGMTAKSYAQSVRKLRDSFKSADSAVKRYQTVQHAMKYFGSNSAVLKGSFGADAGFRVFGFAEGFLDQNGTPHYLDSGVIIGISGSANFSLPVYLGTLPFFFETSFSGEGSAQLNLLIQEAAKSFTPNGVVEGTVTLSGGVGFGVQKLASISGGLKGEIADHWEILLNEEDYNRLTVTLKAYAKGEIILFSGSKTWDLAQKVWEWPDRASMQSLEESYAALYEDFDDPGFYTLKSEEEMTDRSVFLANDGVSLFAGEDGGAREAPFAESVYSQAQPKLVSFSDGTLLAVWTGLDNSRAAYDRPRLYYALCENGAWSRPAPVDMNGSTMEGEPSLTADGSTACLAWCRANGPMGTPADLTEAAAKLDIFAGVFDLESRQWTVKQLTDDQKADFSPAVCCGNGGAAVVWQSNSQNDLFGKNGTTSISCSRYTDGTWADASIQYNNVGALSNLTAELSGDTPRIAWAKTEADGTLAVYRDGQRQGSGSGAAFYNGSLYWYRDGCLYQDGQDTGAALASDRFQIENNTLLYVSGNGLYSTLTAHYYDPASGRWSDAVALTDGRQSIGSFSAASVGTDLQVLMSSTEVKKEMDEISSDSDDPYGSTDLILLADAPVCDLSIGKPWYPEDTYTPNSTMEFHLEVTNNGTVPTYYVVTARGGDGSEYTAASRQSLLPGCTEEIAVAYKQGETLCGQLSFTVTALNGTDTNAANDQTTLTLQYEDVSVEQIGNGVTEDGQYRVYADIVNRGYGVQSGLTVGLYRDKVSGTPLQTVTIASIASMSSQPVNFHVPAPADQACYVIAVSGSANDMNAATDSDFTVCTLRKDAPLGLLSLDGRQVELWLENAPAGTLVVAAYDGSGRMDVLGMSAVSAGAASARITMPSAVPEGDSLTAFLLDTTTKKPLTHRVNLSYYFGN